MTPAQARFDVAAPLPRADDLGRVHFIALGGAGVSAVARLMLARGIPVQGSDAKPSALLDALAAEGANPVFVGQRAEQVQDADTVVISSAIREDNPELAAARAAGLRVLHRSQGLAVALEGRRVVAVAGANGKTTTTAMLGEALVAAGADPSFACGADLVRFESNARVGAGPDAVVEADESDGSFLVYHPQVAIVTSVQPDHLDFYGTAEAVADAYRAFADTVQRLLVVCADDPGARDLGDRVRGEGRVLVLTYGYAEDADLRVLDTTAVGLGTSSTLRWRDGTERVLALPVPGPHNVLDAGAALLAATACGADVDRALAGLADFRGARRRFEIKGEADGVRVVDDYAHNAPKVAALVSTAADLVRGSGRLHVVFQPHLYSRTRDFAAGFAAGLAPADHVVLLDIYGAREEPLPGVDTELIAGPLRTASGERVVERVATFEQAVAAVVAAVRPGDLVLTVGAGDVTRLGPMLLEALGEPSR